MSYSMQHIPLLMSESDYDVMIWEVFREKKGLGHKSSLFEYLQNSGAK